MSTAKWQNIAGSKNFFSYLQKNKFDHNIVCKEDKFSDEIIVRHMTYLQDIERCYCLSTFFVHMMQICLEI